MLRVVRQLIPAALKPRLRSIRNGIRHRWIVAWSSFGPAEMNALLRRLGVARGDVVMVHSSFARFEGFSGSLGDAIRLLQEAVGPEGALLLPTLPFSDSAIEYARTNPVMDVKRTPSRMGIMPEIFRRLPGVRRSLHPTHPVAGWGARATRLLDGHRSAPTPCGAGSPFAKLIAADAKVLLLGVDVRSMTFYHYLEEELEATMPFSPFTTEQFTLSVRDADGQTWPVSVRLYDAVVGAQRDVRLMVPDLKARGAWREGKVGRLNAILLRCIEVQRVAAEMAAQGRFCYHDVPRLIARHQAAPRHG
jgi:aminoglycoside 3-N-acetyltransferase